MLKVYKTCCKNCLFSDDRIVSPRRAQSIIKECLQEQTHFICHNATMNDEEIICRAFYDRLGEHSQAIRIAERLEVVEEVDQTQKGKLRSYRELNQED